jgi:hypothetical protein
MATNPLDLIDPKSFSEPLCQKIQELNLYLLLRNDAGGILLMNDVVTELVTLLTGLNHGRRMEEGGQGSEGFTQAKG